MSTSDHVNIAKQYELIQESSLLRKYDKTFQQDLDRIKLRFQELCNNPQTQEMFEKAKTEKAQKYLKRSSDNFFKVKTRIRTGVNIPGEKSFIMIRILHNPEAVWGPVVYDPNTDSIVYNFYIESPDIGCNVLQNFEIRRWFSQNQTKIDSQLAHELSHFYKERFRTRGSGSRNFVSPTQVIKGEKTSADYAMYDDEKESYLSQIWQEMLACNTNGDKTFHHCLLQSITFKRILKSFGVSSYTHKTDSNTSVLSNVDKLRNLDKGYRELYNYFMTKTHELWTDKGYKFNDFNDQMYTHRLQKFATSLSPDIFDEFTNDEKVKVLKTDIELPYEIFKFIDFTLKGIYLEQTPPLNLQVFASLNHQQQQQYTLERYKKIVKTGIQCENDTLLLTKNKRLYDVIMLPERRKARKLEEEIRSKLKGKQYDGDVTVTSKYVLPNLHDIVILGNYNCNNLNILTLQGAPKSVSGDFNCSHNNIHTLEHSPESVIGNFDCTNNKISSLISGPLYVHGNFYCTNNSIKSLEHGPKEVRGDYHCEGNPLESMEINTKIKGMFFSNQYTNEQVKSQKRKSSNKTIATENFVIQYRDMLK